LCNLKPDAPAEVACELRGLATGDSLGTVTGRVLTAPQSNAHNTFDAPDNVRPEAFTAFHVDGHKIRVTLPAQSVTVLAIG